MDKLSLPTHPRHLQLKALWRGSPQEQGRARSTVLQGSASYRRTPAQQRERLRAGLGKETAQKETVTSFQKEFRGPKRESHTWPWVASAWQLRAVPTPTHLQPSETHHQGAAHAHLRESVMPGFPAPTLKRDKSERLGGPQGVLSGSGWADNTQAPSAGGFMRRGAKGLSFPLRGKHPPV